MRRKTKDWAVTVLGLTVCAILVAVLAASKWVLVVVRGESMLPTYGNSAVLVAARGNGLVRGGVAVFREPAEWPSSGGLAVKRVAAVEGDVLSASSGAITVKGGSEWTAEWPPECPDASVEVPDGFFFAVGDNPSNSFDSMALSSSSCDLGAGLIDSSSVVAASGASGPFVLFKGSGAPSDSERGAAR